MKRVNLFSATSHYRLDNQPRIQLLLQGHPTGRDLRGRLLLDQFASGQRYVLITGDDNPFEEALHIYLLDLELNLLDEMELSQPYTPGSYQAHHHRGERLVFTFFAEGIWCLEVRERPKTQPLNYDHYPVRRPIKLWGQQYLRLQREVQVA
ncbi:MAG: hypothetical protein SV765_08720 [Pseudomonadota bacterium]|nr:hypothetical protein [Pseudomonadales bacterium]MDY6920284.1 hypothetical protein [Pseudomonadota bacterium]